MKSIWYFVGLLLVTMGIIITASGLYSFMNPPTETKVFSQYHPDLWWGIFMLAFGLVFVLLNRSKIVR
jgi:FtsH-binding integral membrane protein